MIKEALRESTRFVVFVCWRGRSLCNAQSELGYAVVFRAGGYGALWSVANNARRLPAPPKGKCHLKDPQ